MALLSTYRRRTVHSICLLYPTQLPHHCWHFKAMAFATFLLVSYPHLASTSNIITRGNNTVQVLLSVSIQLLLFLLGCEIMFGQFQYHSLMWGSHTLKTSLELVSSFLLYHLGIFIEDLTNFYTRRVWVLEDIFDSNTVRVCIECKNLQS